ncbi:DUF421 domain-containing protein [Cytobacillus purgationiresistens]|uniref:Uncharacterized membrane protein YcaP (DUF421 family) n=1 Tax=Cytobacillus purgationiresistens TaxID=863449 RepID=A0ABU0AQL6_9BACI|nr:DUF421 domain-containing protein [Cytobacillus purgationiresistens]MDQ0272315.1 uncharacterized membrane protein YcaP (DUF421 family) [Cytobacillus purgationiresistens]
MNDILEILIRTICAVVLIMIITRMLGKQTIAQMTYHGFVAAITLGSITANLAFNLSLKSWLLAFSLITFSGVLYMLTLAALKSRNARNWISGKPTVVVENGKILEQNLKKLKLTLDTLTQELREKDIFDIEEVEYAVFELNGRISVLRKPEYLPVIRRDLGISSNKIAFPIELIMDGKIIVKNLKQNQLTKEWLDEELTKRGLSLEQVFYAVKSTTGNLFLDLYKDNIHQPIDKE